MKFLYVDESGLQKRDRFLVFFGLLIDGYRLKKAMREARPVLDDVKNAYPGSLRELKSSRLVNGVGDWRRVDADERKRLFVRLCSFPTSTAIHGYVYVLDKRRYNTARESAGLPAWAPTPWLASATALCMFVQREHQKIKNNKGLTILIFDDNKMELPKLSDFLIRSADDVDAFYTRHRKADPFDQIIDTAFAIKSDHSRMVQISDACAFALRRRAEIEIGGSAERWEGELEFFRCAVESFTGRLIFPSRTWVRNPECEAGEWIRDHGIQNLNHWVSS